jgi:hypothetical protein
MSYQVAQDSEYVGNNYWKWSAWIEAEPAELDAVAEVTWVLHPTFKQPRVSSSDRARKFRLDTAGWGTFLLAAELRLKTGDVRVLKHKLTLVGASSRDVRDLRDARESAPAEAHRPTVFLSYGAQDSQRAAELRDALRTENVKVLDQSSLSESEVWEPQLRHMLSHADVVVGLVGGDTLSPFVRAELREARATDKPAFALVFGEGPSAGLPSEVQTIPVGGLRAKEIVQLLVRTDRLR